MKLKQINLNNNNNKLIGIVDLVNTHSVLTYNTKLMRKILCDIVKINIIW